MDSGYLPRHEHEEFAKRMEEEHRRQNHRIGEVEDQLKENNRLLISVERLAVNMEGMQKEQKDQGERLEVLENRDGEAWRNVKWYALTVVLGAVIGYLMNMAGI